MNSLQHSCTLLQPTNGKQVLLLSATDARWLQHVLTVTHVVALLVAVDGDGGDELANSASVARLKCNLVQPL
jgi:hypothetical protein